MNDRDRERRELGAAAVVSEATAVRWLPNRDVNGREWLRENGLVNEHPKLGRIVLWGEVLEVLRLEALRRKGEPEDPPPRAASGYPRAALKGDRR